MSSSTAAVLTHRSAPAIGFFERYLTVWVALCVVLGLLLGQAWPVAFHNIAGLEGASVNIPVGILIWLMLVPTLITIDFRTVPPVRAHRRGLVVTSRITRLATPFPNKK